MKKQNQASTLKGRTTKKTPQQKQRIKRRTGKLDAGSPASDPPTHHAHHGFSSSCGGGQVIAHAELARLINRGPVKSRRQSPRDSGAERINTHFVTIELTEAQRVQLAQPYPIGSRITYGEFLHVATHEQLTALRGSVPLYWAGLTHVDQPGCIAPKQLVSMRGRKSDGTGDVWLYTWMSQARLELSTELKRRRIKEKDYPSSRQKLREEDSITVIVSVDVATAIKNGARLRLLDERTDSFICYARATEEQSQ
jgi:hypothetical protein